MGFSGFVQKFGKPLAGPFPKLLRARDGPKQAHMDVLVACFGKGSASGFVHQK